MIAVLDTSTIRRLLLELFENIVEFLTVLDLQFNINLFLQITIENSSIMQV